MRLLNKASLAFEYLLIAAAAVMLGWGVLGFAEYLLGAVILMPLQNPTFPAGTQFLHWTLITAAGGTYLAGYFTRWKYTPPAMVVIYAMLATMCFIQTFDFMTNPERFAALARESLYYVGISLFLFRSERMQERFGRAALAR